MGEVIIPLSSARSLDDAADYLLKNRCGRLPDNGRRAAYKAGMKAKNINHPLDLRKKDVRWWPAIRQSWSRVIVINEKELPACLVVGEPKKEEVKPEVPASKPAKTEAAENKPIEIKSAPVKVPTKGKKKRPGLGKSVIVP